MDKSELRTRIRQSRRLLRAQADVGPWRQRGSVIAKGVLAVPEVWTACNHGSAIASYVSFGGEPPTEKLNEALAAAGARVLLPATARDGRTFDDLAWADLEQGVDRDSSALIPTPAGPLVGRGSAGLLDLGCAVIIIPALGVGLDGSRLGQGGGYYDRMLSTLPHPGPLRLALVGPGEVFDTVPHDPHDQPIDRYLEF
ncbi:MAG: 5-formyltetrahydrofolate cyclo-ligase [Actinomycetes bacterium]